MSKSQLKHDCPAGQFFSCLRVGEATDEVSIHNGLVLMVSNRSATCMRRRLAFL